MRKQSGLFFLVVLLLLGAALVGVTVMNYRFAEQFPGGGDFVPRYLGSRMYLMEGINPYSDEVTRESQFWYYGRPARPGEDPVTYLYPLYAIVFFGIPALFENFAFARALWMTILQAALVAGVFLSLRLVDWKVKPLKLAALLIFALLWYSGVRNVINGQIAALNTVLIIWGLLAIQRKEDVLAGFLLALSTIKPQMVYLLLPFIVLWALSVRRYILLASLAGSAVGLFVITMALIPTWPIQMLQQIVAYPGYTDIGSVVSILANGLPGIRGVINITLNVLGFLYLFAEWFFAWGKDERWFTWTALMTLVLTNFIALRTATTHFVALIPVMLLVFRVWEQRWKAGGVQWMYATLVVLLVGLWALFLGTVEGNVEQAVMYLPVPFFCLFAMWWVRWWAVRSPRMMLHEFSENLR